jgi:hypothetical protein
VSVGWNTFKANPVPLILGYLVANLLFMIPIVGAPLGLAGLLYMSLKALRGQTPEVKDVLVAFQAPVDHIVIGLLGLIACCIGALVTAPLFAPGLLLIADKGMTWQDAKDRCMEHVKPAWLAWTVFWLVLMLLNMAGTLACVVGVFVTGPMSMIAFAYAYEQTWPRVYPPGSHYGLRLSPCARRSPS